MPKLRSLPVTMTRAHHVLLDGAVVFKAADQRQARLVAGALVVYESLMGCPFHRPGSTQGLAACTCDSRYAMAAVLETYAPGVSQ